MFFLPDFDLRSIERPRVVHLAEAALSSEPRSLTSARNPRSGGGAHDFSSEGDYWWPDEKNPDGASVRRDGLTNPGNFTAHRSLMFAMARDVGALAAAYDLSGAERFAIAALRHLRVWFVDPPTRMNPNLQFAQAIKGVATGRGIGIIDTVHLAEVALSIEALRSSPAMTLADDAALTGWFRDYLRWITTHPYGLDEAKAENNHGTCWALQAAAFARLMGDRAALVDCRRRLTEILLPGQMAADGSFPRELARTKPYGYSIFNLDVMSGLAVLLSTPTDNLMRFVLPDGRGLLRGVEFLAPFLADKTKWPGTPDVMNWGDWPIRQPALLFGALASGNRDWLATWQGLPADSGTDEIRRNFPIRFPTLWLRHLRPAAPTSREVFNFNPDWRFTKSDPAGAASPGFDDAGWTQVSTPHTFNDTDTFDNWSLPGHKGEQDQWSGRTWYRKTFIVPKEWASRKVLVEFEGARQVAEVYLNGDKLGEHKTGFTPFGFDLTPHLRPGAANVLAVMVDNRFMRDPADVSPAGTGATTGQTKTLAQITAEHNSAVPEHLDDLRADQIPWNNPHWHPPHGGLYRNVWLHVADPLHVTLPLFSFLQTEGPYLYATKISPESANLHVDVPVVNERTTSEHFDIGVEVFDAEGRPVLALKHPSAALEAGARSVFQLAGSVVAPRLWEPDYPHLYRAVITLRRGGVEVDRSEVSCGIRAVRWDPLAGFFINGRHLKLQGWGQKPTNEWPGLGAALPDWLHEYTLRLMKEAGGNFVRWGHTAAGPAQIAAGDRLGLIALQPGVDGEGDTVRAAWQLRATAFRDVVIYFRNNPSILVWEGGNQKLPREKVAELRGYMDRYDPHGGRAYTHRRADQVTAEFMDIGVGTEGGREIARLPVVEGEYNREESPRRVWDDFSPPNFGYPEALGQTYQLTSEQFAARQVGHFVRKLGAPEHSGGANWIFSDSTSGGRVSVEVARASGEVDAVRLPKEAYHAVAAMWSSTPAVRIIGHWTYPPGTTKSIYVVANAAAVELFLNDRSLGQGKISDRNLFTFENVSWEPGELKAVASRDGQIVATHQVRPAGVAVALRVTPMVAPGGLRADGADVALFDIEAVDDQGQRCPTFQQRVDFEMNGPGIWRGGYNSGKLDSTNHPWLDLEAGVNRVAVRATRTSGTITVSARAAGLRAGSASVEAGEFAAENDMTVVAPAVAAVRLPPARPTHPDFAAPQVSRAMGESTAKMVGRFVKAFGYSGPSSYIVHVEILARDGKNAYVDADSPFVNLPAGLTGADWVQAAGRESLYHAVDLMQIEVMAGATVFVAHDDRLARPPWLRARYQPTEQRIEIGGQLMTLFSRLVASDESLTLGPNTEDATVKEAKMYVVFVNATNR